MNKLFKITCLSLAVLSIAACEKKNKSANNAVVEDKVLVNNGTYKGVVDIKGQEHPSYVVIALDDNKYELLNKELTNQNLNVTKGELKASHDSASLDNGMLFIAKGDTLIAGPNAYLVKTSDDKSLEEIYTTQVLKENKSGENYTLQTYVEKGKQMATFNFKGTEYVLTLNPENKETVEYVSEGNSLKLPKVIAKVSDVISFTNGKETYTFSKITPGFEVLETADKDAAVKNFDVLYYTNGEKPVVLLIGNDQAHSYKLTQQDDPMLYKDGNVEWRMGRSGAVLVVDGKQVKYVAKK